jgi:hypothetical protein
MTTDVVSRLAAANPVPSGHLPEPRPLRVRPHRALFAFAAAAAFAVPAAAFADDIGRLLGFSNQGTTVATSSLSLSTVSGLAGQMRELGFPSSLHLLGTRDGISFYAARKADGHYCFAIESTRGRGFGCTTGGNSFPSAEEPALAFPPYSRLAGFAADAVASVAMVDADGATLASAPVSENLFSGGEVPAGAVALEALDASGNVITTRKLR